MEKPPSSSSTFEPGSAASTAPRSRGVLPSLVVLAVLCFVVFGGYVVADALSRPAGPPVTVGGVLRLSPLSGWELARRLSNPPGVRLTRGIGNLDVVTMPFVGSASGLAHEYVHGILGPQADRLSVGGVETVRLGSGRIGVRFSYVGLFGKGQAAIEGQVTVVVGSSGVGAVFDGWAPQGVLQYVLDDIDAMIDAAGFR